MKLQFLLLIVFYTSILNISQAQDIWNKKTDQFIAYDKIPTWAAVISHWTDKTPKVHLYNRMTYKGHADFVSKGLKTGLTFAQFKDRVKNPKTRQYIPFFLYDLRKTPITIDGISYKWALRMEDYSYEDNASELALTVLKTIHTVYKYLLKADPKVGKGIIVLANSNTARPNTTAKGLLNKNGYPNKTISELIKLAEPSSSTRSSKNSRPNSTSTDKGSVKILNEGIAYGYVQYIKAGEEKKINSNYQNILVYEQLPYRVPIASGMITLEPQTPLSHINLLAKNRGTINAYILGEHSTKTILKQSIGKLVKIQTSKNGLSISPAKKEDAQKFWTAKKNLKVSIPKADKEMKFLSYFEIGGKAVQTANYIGTKASNYAMLQHEFPKYVRHGFGVPFYFYFETIKEAGADKLIKTLQDNSAKLSVSERNKQLKAIQARILAAKVPKSLLNQLRNMFDEYFKNTKIRLRSSTNCEDLPQFNGAGLYKSKGFHTKSSDAELEKKILEVYASLWSTLAFEERDFFGINHQQVGMAILINQSFDEEYANGVAITIPNSSGTPSIYINSQTGENAVTNPSNGQIPEAIIFKQFDSKWYSTQSKSNIKNIFVDNAKLTPTVRELQKITAQIDKLFRTKLSSNDTTTYGIDLEFKILKVDGIYQLYIKQARLLNTTLPQ